MRHFILIPFYGTDPHREELFQAVLSFYKSEVKEIPKVTNDPIKDFLVPDQRGSARNHMIRGMDLEDHDIIAIMDADVLVQADALRNAFEAVKQGASWALPYSKSGYYRLNQATTKEFFETDLPWSKPEGESKIYLNRPKKDQCLIGGFKSYASALVMTYGFFERCGGYDERFRGWGYEDDAFRDVALTFGGEPWRSKNGFLIHLWHPEPNPATWAQPDIQHNKQLYVDYRVRCGSQSAMKSYLRQRN